MLSLDTFHESVRNRHRRVDVDDWDDVYVVGDVHGCLDPFERLVTSLDGENVLFVVVGDLVRKGPDSQGVVEFVRSRENVYSVLGNNEAKILNGETELPELTAEDEAYIAGLPVVVTWEGAMVVHGGVDPRRPLAEQPLEELLTMRSFTPDGGYDRPYWFEEYDDEPRIFFGHTVLAHPYESAGAVGLDTGCVYGGRLTAYHWNEGTTHAVEPAETHQERSEDSIVVPRDDDQADAI